MMVRNSKLDIAVLCWVYVIHIPKCIADVLNPELSLHGSNYIRLLVPRMLSVGLHLAQLGSNLSMIELQMVISEKLPAGHTC